MCLFSFQTFVQTFHSKLLYSYLNVQIFQLDQSQINVNQHSNGCVSHMCHVKQHKTCVAGSANYCSTVVTPIQAIQTIMAQPQSLTEMSLSLLDKDNVKMMVLWTALFLLHQGCKCYFTSTTFP